MATTGYFGFSIIAGNCVKKENICNSKGRYYSSASGHSMRPVVTLNENVEIDKEAGGDGSQSNPWKLKVNE